MGYKEVLRVDISEVIRRWQAGNSRHHIASGTGLSRGSFLIVDPCRREPSAILFGDPSLQDWGLR